MRQLVFGMFFGFLLSLGACASKPSPPELSKPAMTGGGSGGAMSAIGGMGGQIDSPPSNGAGSPGTGSSDAFVTIDVDTPIGLAIDDAGNRLILSDYPSYDPQTHAPFGNIIVAFNPQGDHLYDAPQLPITATSQFPSLSFYSISAGLKGTSYVAGNVSGMLEGETISGGLAIAKFDASGKSLWAHQVQGLDAYGVTSDTSGNVYATTRDGGGVSDFLDTLTAKTPADTLGDRSFIVKYDANGKYLWTSQISSSSGYQVDPIVADEKANVYVGIIGECPSPIVSCVAVVKMDAEGNWQWTTRLQAAGNANSDDVVSVSVSADGKAVYVAGKTAFDFGRKEFPRLPTDSAGSPGAGFFVIKLDKDGALTWGRTIQIPAAYDTCSDPQNCFASVEAIGMAADRDGSRLQLVGYAGIKSGGTTPQTRREMYAIQLNGSGDIDWQRQYPPSADDPTYRGDLPIALAHDSDETPVLLGAYLGPNKAAPQISTEQIFLTRLDTDDGRFF